MIRIQVIALIATVSLIDAVAGADPFGLDELSPYGHSLAGPVRPRPLVIPAPVAFSPKFQTQVQQLIPAQFQLKPQQPQQQPPQVEHLQSEKSAPKKRLGRRWRKRRQVCAGQLESIRARVSEAQAKLAEAQRILNEIGGQLPTSGADTSNAPPPQEHGKSQVDPGGHDDDEEEDDEDDEHSSEDHDDETSDVMRDIPGDRQTEIQQSNLSSGPSPDRQAATNAKPADVSAPVGGKTLLPVSSTLFASRDAPESSSGQPQSKGSQSREDGKASANLVQSASPRNLQTAFSSPGQSTESRQLMESAGNHHQEAKSGDDKSNLSPESGSVKKQLNENADATSSRANNSLVANEDHNPYERSRSNSADSQGSSEVEPTVRRAQASQDRNQPAVESPTATSTQPRAGGTFNPYARSAGPQVSTKEAPLAVPVVNHKEASGPIAVSAIGTVDGGQQQSGLKVADPTTLEADMAPGVAGAPREEPQGGRKNKSENPYNKRLENNKPAPVEDLRPAVSSSGGEANHGDFTSPAAPQPVRSATESRMQQQQPSDDDSYGTDGLYDDDDEDDDDEFRSPGGSKEPAGARPISLAELPGMRHLYERPQQQSQQFAGEQAPRADELDDLDDLEDPPSPSGAYRSEPRHHHQQNPFQAPGFDGNGPQMGSPQVAPVGLSPLALPNGYGVNHQQHWPQPPAPMMSVQSIVRGHNDDDDGGDDDYADDEDAGDQLSGPTDGGGRRRRGGRFRKFFGKRVRQLKHVGNKVITGSNHLLHDAVAKTKFHAGPPVRSMLEQTRHAAQVVESRLRPSGRHHSWGQRPRQGESGAEALPLARTIPDRLGQYPMVPPLAGNQVRRHEEHFDTGNQQRRTLAGSSEQHRSAGSRLESMSRSADGQRVSVKRRNSFFSHSSTSSSS